VSGCVEHEGSRAFGCKACDAVGARMSESGWRNLAWLRSRVVELEAEVATLRALRCAGSTGCRAHLVLNVEENARGCEHGVLVGHCYACKREIQPGQTHDLCKNCHGAGGRYVAHPNADGRYVDIWEPCPDHNGGGDRTAKATDR
jgi:hypothetical protein